MRQKISPHRHRHGLKIPTSRTKQQRSRRPTVQPRAQLPYPRTPKSNRLANHQPAQKINPNFRLDRLRSPLVVRLQMTGPEPEIKGCNGADWLRINPKPPLGRSIHNKRPTLLHFRHEKHAIFPSQTSVITHPSPESYKPPRFHVEHFIAKIYTFDASPDATPQRTA